MTPLDQVYAYHERTKHRPSRYAAGPSSLDWDHQPDPFRRFSDCQTVTLPLVADGLEGSWQALFAHPAAPRPLDLRTIGALLELSLGLDVW